jgi:hypothetical protein
LSQHSSAKDSSGKSDKEEECWGCGENHVWYSKKNKVIMCPNQNKPGVLARAELKFKEFKKAVSLRRNNSKKRNAGSQMANFFDAISGEPPESKSKSSDVSNTDTDKADKMKAFLQKMYQDQVNGNNSSASSKNNSSVQHHCFALVFAGNTDNSSRPLLPIPLTTNLPHIKLGLGLPDSSFKPTTMAIIDTAAALTTGNSSYHLMIAEKFPMLIKSIVWEKDQYSPITLSGIVNESDTNKKIQTDLPAVIEYHMPYYTADGGPTSLKVAIGKQVSVNLILGLTFLQATNTQIDLNDNVADCKLLSSKPFEIYMQAPACGLPRIIPLDGDHANNSLFTQTLTQITECKSFINNINEPARSAAIQAAIEKTESVPKVSFDIRPSAMIPAEQQ